MSNGSFIFGWLVIAMCFIVFLLFVCGGVPFIKDDTIYTFKEVIVDAKTSAMLDINICPIGSYCSYIISDNNYYAVLDMTPAQFILMQKDDKIKLKVGNSNCFNQRCFFQAWLDD